MRFKVFFGVDQGHMHADDMANDWLDEHPEVVVTGWEFHQARYGDHSICISYEVVEEDEEYEVEEVEYKDEEPENIPDENAK